MAYVDFAKVKEARAHAQTMLLWPERWAAANASLVLTWEHVAFAADQVDQVPEVPGVYAFTIEPRLASSVPAIYLMYVGQTMKQTLRDRFRQYVKEAQSETGRPRVTLMLNIYSGHLHFYWTTPTPGTSPSDLEDELLKTYLPPVNDQYPAEVRRIMKAFQ